ncbi:MFS transporter [Quadrisphaera sp. GCM10027208]|uniref:MFS transporter n=1 Tax=Quadrisphaera sp. GCM10027208 TaxID=3273423 RepID=UPI003612E50A
MLVSLSTVSTIVGLTAGFMGIRLAGQGALGLVATTATSLWFARRRGTALGLVSAVGAAGISLAPVGLERLISGMGWRTAWAVEGVAVWLVVIPLALWGMRDRPQDVGQHVGGRAPLDHGARPDTDGVTRAVAMRNAFFWVVTAGVAASGMLSTAVAFHQISLLGERGLSPVEAAENFIPQTVASLTATLATGALVDRTSPRWVTSASMGLLAAGLVAGTVVGPGWSAVVFGVLIGAAGGSIRTLEAAAFPRYFGTAHLGSIRGFVDAVSVGSTAFGPLLFAVVHEATGSYGGALLGTAALPLAVAVAALAVRPPRGNEPAVRALHVDQR